MIGFRQSSSRKPKRRDVSPLIKKTLLHIWHIKPDTVCSTERTYDASLSHRSAPEPDNKSLFGGTIGGTSQNRMHIKYMISNAYAWKYGPLLAPLNPTKL